MRKARGREGARTRPRSARWLRNLIRSSAGCRWTAGAGSCAACRLRSVAGGLTAGCVGSTLAVYARLGGLALGLVWSAESPKEPRMVIGAGAVVLVVVVIYMLARRD